jgi:hypothetical protein
MNEITIFGKAYDFPSIKDERFLELQASIEEGKERIAKGEKPKGISGLLGKRVVPDPVTR